MFNFVGDCYTILQNGSDICFPSRHACVSCSTLSPALTSFLFQKAIFSILIAVHDTAWSICFQCRHGTRGLLMLGRHSSVEPHPLQKCTSKSIFVDGDSNLFWGPRNPSLSSNPLWARRSSEVLWVVFAPSFVEWIPRPFHFPIHCLCIHSCRHEKYPRKP